MKQREFPHGITWAERIEMGNILASQDLTAYQKGQALLDLLHPNEGLFFYAHVDYVEQIFECVKYWAEKEAEELSVPPTPEEVQAGVYDLTEKLGEQAAIIAVSKAYHLCPDEVLQWPYPTVFMHLHVEAEQAKFARRLQEVYARKK